MPKGRSVLTALKRQNAGKRDGVIALETDLLSIVITTGSLRQVFIKANWLVFLAHERKEDMEPEPNSFCPFLLETDFV